MSEGRTVGGPTPQSIERDVIAIVADVVQDWDLDFSGGLGRDTRLIGDLGFQSIDVVMLVGELHKHFGRRNLPFERILVVDGDNVDELTVGAIVDFLHAELGGTSGAAASGGAG